MALHVCTRYRRGGSERRIRDIVTAFPELRHHLVVGADSDVDLAREQTSADQVWMLPSLVRQVAPLRDLLAMGSLWRVLRRGRYDLVITHQSKAGALGRMAAIMSRGRPSIVHSLSMASFGPGYGRAENFAFKRLERFLGTRTAAVCVVGADLADRFSAVGVPAERLHVVRSGVPLPSQHRPREQARRLVAERYGVPLDRPLLCYVGSLDARKNVLLLVDVLNGLHDGVTSPPFLLIIGAGPQREDLDNRLRESGLAQDAVLTGHLTDPDHVADALRAADLVLLLSQTEGLPQVLVQAAAAGTPFVAFDVEGVREILSMGAVGSAVVLGNLPGIIDAAQAQLGAGSTSSEPTADLSSWTPDSIRAAYRSVLSAVVAQRSGSG